MPNPGKSEEIKPPNIIVIITDDLNCNDLGIYGGMNVITPKINKLAMNGLRFTNFHVTDSGSVHPVEAFLPDIIHNLTGHLPCSVMT
jgi:arylsulfatase A-like enzyme